MINLFDLRWDVQTAGPSPNDNKRTEVYFAGCSKAINGNPCKNCFNTKLWYPDNSKQTTPEELANKIISLSSNKYVTICGGEPTDQIDDLIKLCSILKIFKYNILVYTYHIYEDMINNDKYKKLFTLIDMLVDGPYIDSKRVYKDNGTDGIYSSIGSSNQRLIFFYNGYAPYMYTLNDNKRD